MDNQEQAPEAPPEDQAITPDGEGAALPDEAPPPGEPLLVDYRYDDLEYDADVAAMPLGYEVTLRGLCQAAAFRIGLTSALEWNQLDMDKRQDEVAEQFVMLSDLLMQTALIRTSAEMVPSAQCVHHIDQARALPLQPEGSVGKLVPHLPGTVVRFRDVDGATMVVVSVGGVLHKAPAADQPQED